MEWLALGHVGHHVLLEVIHAAVTASSTAHRSQLQQRLGVWLDHLYIWCVELWNTWASYDPPLTCLLDCSPQGPRPACVWCSVTASAQHSHSTLGGQKLACIKEGASAWGTACSHHSQSAGSSQGVGWVRQQATRLLSTTVMGRMGLPSGPSWMGRCSRTNSSAEQPSGLQGHAETQPDVLTILQPLA
ncbi:hypothetical protein HaLaN_00274 [Haematococcus lacustris]|uniref:Uncharacterized protein n=1 Tax=Haematococcus lacustris TaxID=44745 RepID=A0A699Y6A7_HAELA|nr:hypothetical protein HaLaN_00274 [Haematococcus lacustris]